MTTINDLPPEILVHIFSYVLESETQENFVKNVAKVCRMWEEASKDASLWRYFDGTLSFPILKNYSKKGYLRQTKELVFSTLKKIKLKKNDNDKINNFKLLITKIYENMQELKCINFSNAIEFLETPIGNVLIESSSCCIGLQKMIVNDKNFVYYPAFSYNLFNNFIEFHGPKLVSLDFSNIFLKGVKELLLNIASSCPNLEELIVQNLSKLSSSPIFPIEVMQNGLPKLKVLRLGYTFILQQKPSVKYKGFPNLEVFTYPSHSNYHFIDTHFKKLLMKSPNLKVLDIRGTHISCAAVSSLPASNVERLYVSHTRLL
ncbi:f-box domain-containing protein [Caerostris extrusa]|uniref:F-box domain-containing protein n=1 Tax=Caerostris extrusa TaxID=172846 RepID=A0AAV4UVV3_CAEEX|nr:f-box domain-containing protein [Caerostris extrusa]